MVCFSVVAADYVGSCRLIKSESWPVSRKPHDLRGPRLVECYIAVTEQAAAFSAHQRCRYQINEVIDLEVNCQFEVCCLYCNVE